MKRPSDHSSAYHPFSPDPIRIFPDLEEMSYGVAEAFAAAARKAIRAKGRFTVALAGGTTPRPLYEILARRYRDTIPWGRVHFFWSDERYVPLDHPDSNYRSAREILFDRVAVERAHIHPVPTEGDDPDEAARRYEKTILDATAEDGRSLDWIFLGLGEDGHVASLFPGADPANPMARSVLVVRNSPKPPPVRVTMTHDFINRAGEVHFLVSGGTKADALRSTLEGPRDPRRWPAQAVHPVRGKLTWWLDEEAAGKLRSRGTGSGGPPSR